MAPPERGSSLLTPLPHSPFEALGKDIAGNGFVRAEITDLLLPKSSFDRA